MKKIIIPLGNTMLILFIVGMALFVGLPLGNGIITFNEEIMMSIFSFVFALLGFLVIIFVFIVRKVILLESVMIIPSDYGTVEEYVREKHKKRTREIKYTDLVSVELIGKGKKQTVDFADRKGKRYHLNTELYSKKQIEYIISEVRKRAGLV